VIDLKRLSTDPAYRHNIERKRVREGLVDEVLDVYARSRLQSSEVQQMRAEQKKRSKDARGKPSDALRELASTLKEREALLRDDEALLRELALQLPNAADDTVPDGGEDDAEVLRTIGPTSGAPPLDHAAFGEVMGFVDMPRAAEASGTRFAYIMREAALLELALVTYAMNAITRHGFTPVVTPALVRERTMEEAGFFPTDRSQVYDVDDGELFLVGTSEVPLSAIHRDEVLSPDVLPARYGGLSSCFRREAGTHGKDTRGIFRVHQFDKVEMFVYAEPSVSNEEHELILAIEEEIIGGLGIPYRVVNIAAGDLGAAAAKKYDIEGWLPSEGRYRELTSCSNYTDYSARRLRTRVKNEQGTELVHTLNGTACAVSRTLVFLFEHYQDADSRFAVPDVLRPYSTFETVEPRK